jgi:D-glycero-D-manno-heptose 1,7-bisphosphate phosphatase
MRWPVMLNEPLVFSFRPLTAENTLFLDRDGVLLRPVMRGDEVSAPRSMEEIQIEDDIDSLAQPDIARNWNMVVISNQPDLSRGRFGVKFVDEVHRQINERIPLNAAYICPHLQSENCDCRKPKIGLLERFRRDHPGRGRKEYLVGDRSSDCDCAREAGVQFVLRKRPYNSELAAVAPLLIDDLWELGGLLPNNNGKVRT